MKPFRRRRAGSDEGLTMVELVVVIAVGAILSALIAGIFISGLQSQTATRDRDVATGKAQLVADSLQTSLRNADGIRVDGNTLWAHVATGESGWECRAWALTDNGSLVYTHSTSAIGAVDESNGAKLISTQDGLQGAAVSVSAIDGKPLFREVDGQLAYALAVTVGDATVRVAGSVAPQARSEGTAPSCNQ